MSAKQNVVVVGGGSAGLLIAKELSAKLDPAHHQLVVVNPRPFEVFYPPLVRAVVTAEGRIEDGALNPISKVFANGNGTVKLGRVARVEHTAAGDAANRVVLEGGEAIDYAALVLAPGAVWEGPIALPDTREEVDEHLAEWRAKFKGAKHVVLAGGGAVGLEIAGEVKDVYPDTKVTIVHGQRAPLNDAYPDKLRNKALAGLAARGVELVFDDYIDTIPAAGTTGVRTRKGRDIPADLVVPTRGGRPNTEFLADFVKLTANGHVPVAPTLEIADRPGVFVAGDVLDWKEQKQAAKTGAHAAVVVQNVLSSLAGKQPAKRYGGSKELIVITNGKTGGVAYLGGFVLGAWFAKMIKSKDLLIGMHKKQFGF